MCVVDIFVRTKKKKVIVRNSMSSAKVVPGCNDESMAIEQTSNNKVSEDSRASSSNKTDNGEDNTTSDSCQRIEQTTIDSGTLENIQNKLGRKIIFGDEVSEGGQLHKVRDQRRSFRFSK